MDLNTAFLFLFPILLGVIFLLLAKWARQTNRIRSFARTMRSGRAVVRELAVRGIVSRGGCPLGLSQVQRLLAKAAA